MTTQHEDISFSIGDNEQAQRMLLNLAISKLYTNPQKACVTEIISNCIDAHKEAGVKRPVEVTYPSSENSYTISFRDYGRGMNEEFMKNIFTKLGNSTKRDNEDCIGGSLTGPPSL